MVGGTVGQSITAGYCPGAVVGKFVRAAAFERQKVHQVACCRWHWEGFGGSRYFFIHCGFRTLELPVVLF